MPLFHHLQILVLASKRLHGDDTTVPVPARSKTDIARFWTHVRDDRPFGGSSSLEAVSHYSRDRGGEHPQSQLAGYSGILQTDAHGGDGKLYEPGRVPDLILESACWAELPKVPRAQHVEWQRRVMRVGSSLSWPMSPAVCAGPPQGKALAVLSEIGLEAVQRIGALFGIKRDINGHSAKARQAARQALSAPLVTDLHRWRSEHRTRLARGNDVARAIDNLLKRWAAFTRFLDDGRICISNNSAKRALRGIALGRKSWLFCGSDRGGQRAPVMYSLIVTAKMDSVDPQASLADVLARIADHPAQRLNDLLQWRWAAVKATAAS